ncbi:MAG: hypothetical protein AAFN93_30200, partial [Bacteroidota bacterium]
TLLSSEKITDKKTAEEGGFIEIANCDCGTRRYKVSLIYLIASISWLRKYIIHNHNNPIFLITEFLQIIHKPYSLLRKLQIKKPQRKEVS